MKMTPAYSSHSAAYRFHLTSLWVYNLSELEDLFILCIISSAFNFNFPFISQPVSMQHSASPSSSSTTHQSQHEKEFPSIGWREFGWKCLENQLKYLQRDFIMWCVSAIISIIALPFTWECWLFLAPTTCCWLVLVRGNGGKGLIARGCDYPANDFKSQFLFQSLNTFQNIWADTFPLSAYRIPAISAPLIPSRGVEWRENLDACLHDVIGYIARSPCQHLRHHLASYTASSYSSESSIIQIV